MTMTDNQWGFLVGSVAGIIVFLIVIAIHWCRQSKFWRNHALIYRDRAEDAEKDLMMRTHEYRQLIFMRDQAAKEELTPEEVEYLHKSLGVQPPVDN